MADPSAGTAGKLHQQVIATPFTDEHLGAVVVRARRRARGARGIVGTVGPREGEVVGDVGVARVEVARTAIVKDGLADPSRLEQRVAEVVIDLRVRTRLERLLVGGRGAR